MTRPDDAPCFMCKDRVVEPNCHITCEKYLEFSKKRMEIGSKRVEYAKLGAFQRDMQKQAIYRRWRDKNK